MAQRKKKKKKATGSGCAAPIVLILIGSISATSFSDTVGGVAAIIRLILLIIAAPILYGAVVWLVVSLVRVLWQGRGIPALKSGLDFSGTKKEYEIDHKCRLMIESSTARLSSLDERGQDLQRRKDGFFAERSNLASDLNKQMKVARQDLEQSQRILQRVSSYQSKRAYKFMHYRRDYYEIVTAVAVLVAAFAVSYYFQIEQVIRMAGAISESSLLPSALNNVNVISSLFCGVPASISMYWITTRISKKFVVWQLKQPSRLAPEVRLLAAEKLAKRYGIGEI